jgi:2-dehydropantoate 2-reductase
MNTVIVGQGAIGLLFYHRLSQHKNTNLTDESISLLPSISTSLTEYSFSEMDGEAKNFPLTLTDNQTLARAQLIIICVKSYQVADALKAIHHLIADDAILILTHNGLGTLEEISFLFKPTQCLFALLLTQGAKKIADYHIEHTGVGDSNLGIILGEPNATKKRELLLYLQLRLHSIHWQDNIKQSQWEKLAINCVINPLSALENIDNGEIKQPTYQETINGVIKEIVTVASREGLDLSENVLKNLLTKVVDRTTKNTSSMRADVLNKRRTEIDYINGYIHRLGKKHQLATPINTRLWLAVKALEKQYLPHSVNT